MKKFLFAIGLCSLSCFAIAQDEDAAKDYYTIAEVEVSAVDASNSSLMEPQSFLFAAKRGVDFEKLGKAVDSLDELILYGEKAWDLIKKGAPVYNPENVPAISVLPKKGEVNEFRDMTSWSAPKTRHYEVSYKNIWGMEVVNFSFMIKFQHSGQHDGKGAYLTDVAVVPTNVNVVWGFNLNVKTSVQSITNRGTAENPIAGVTIAIDHSAWSWVPARILKDHMEFHVAGNGELNEL